MAGCVCWVEGLGGERSASAAAESIRGRGKHPQLQKAIAAVEVEISRLIPWRYQCK